MKLRRVESGVYETADGEYRVERVDSLGESYNPVTDETNYESTTSVWTITRKPSHPNGEWAELFEAMTKRECVAELPNVIAQEQRKREAKQADDDDLTVAAYLSGYLRGEPRIIEHPDNHEKES